MQQFEVYSKAQADSKFGSLSRPETTTTSLVAATGNGSISVPRLFKVWDVTYSGACRFRIYRTAAGRAADASRPVDLPYPGGLGRCYEFIADGATVDDGYPFDIARALGETKVYYRVDGGPVTITLQQREV